MRALLVLIGVVALPRLPAAQAGGYSAAQLIAGVKAAKPAGAVYARIRMEHAAPGARPLVLQVQVKRRPIPDGGTESLYQILFPKERKGEGLLLRTRKGAFEGKSFAPGRGARDLDASDRSAGIFGTALTIDDLTAGFLDWGAHEIVGREKEGGVACSVVESRPSRGSDARVRSWIDESRLATMKIEFFDGGAQPVRTVTTEKVMRGSNGYYAPVVFTVADRARGISTKVEGVRSEDQIAFGDGDFSEAALRSPPTAPAKGSR